MTDTDDQDFVIVDAVTNDVLHICKRKVTCTLIQNRPAQVGKLAERITAAANFVLDPISARDVAVCHKTPHAMKIEFSPSRPA